MAKGRQNLTSPTKLPTSRRRITMMKWPVLCVCETGHFAKDRPDPADRHGKKGNVNTVIASNEGDKGYGNLLLSS
jgi:hypothetical protein